MKPRPTTRPPCGTRPVVRAISVRKVLAGRYASPGVLLCALAFACTPVASSSRLTEASAKPRIATKGTLLIVGGGSQPDELVRHFVALAGGPGKARIAILPMASSEAAA